MTSNHGARIDPINMTSVKWTAMNKLERQMIGTGVDSDSLTAELFKKTLNVSETEQHVSSINMTQNPFIRRTS